MQNLAFDLEEVFNEIRMRMQTQGAMTQDDYLAMIDEVLEEKQAQGLLDDDFDLKEAHEALEARWPEVAESEDDDKTDYDEEG